MLLILLILLFVLPIGGGWYTNSCGSGYYRGGGIGLGTILIIVLVIYLLGGFR